MTLGLAWLLRRMKLFAAHRWFFLAGNLLVSAGAITWSAAYAEKFLYTGMGCWALSLIIRRFSSSHLTADK